MIMRKSSLALVGALMAAMCAPSAFAQEADTDTGAMTEVGDQSFGFSIRAICLSWRR